MGEFDIDGHKIPYVMNCKECGFQTGDSGLMKEHFEKEHSELFKD